MSGSGIFPATQITDGLTVVQSMAAFSSRYSDKGPVPDTAQSGSSIRNLFSDSESHLPLRLG